MTPETATALAHAMALFAATEHALIAHRHDTAEVVELANRLVACGIEVRRLMAKGEREIVTAPLREHPSHG